MRARDLTKGNIAYHEELNPEVWKGRELRVDVRYKLLEIAKRFIEYLEVPGFKLEDIILRGSLVNYNYTQYSDFDLHIVTDFSTLDCDITEAFYLAKKKIWNDEHDITIKGHEVELYVEDRAAKNVSEGTYSVLDARWLRTPKHNPPAINDRAVSAKARDLMTQINRAVKTGSVEDITRLQDKIRLMRQAGLDASGEFSTENLAYKIIRNKKFLDKLYKTKNSKVDQELSLDESAESYSVKTDTGEEFACNDVDHAKNKARSLLSYKKANKVYILKNGKAIYSWQLNSKLEPMDENESWPKVDGGYEHNGLGYKRDRATGKYPIHPLPRWNIFQNYRRNPGGTWADIYHYMRFAQDSYQTASMDISGDEIANTIAKIYNKNAQQELKDLNSSKGYKFKSWNDFYQALKDHYQNEMTNALLPTAIKETETDWSQQAVIPWLKFSKMLSQQLTALGFKAFKQIDGGYEFHKRPNDTTDISLSIDEETATEFDWQCLVTVNNATQPNANPHQGVLPMTAGSIATVVDSIKKMCGDN